MATRDKILESALTLFAANGYDGTSVEEIAAGVGIKAPSLYKHYKGKEDILNELIDTAESRYEEFFGSENHIGKIPESEEEFVSSTMERIRFTIHDPLIRKIRIFLVKEQFLPVRLDVPTAEQPEKESGYLNDYIVEPSKEELIVKLIPKSLHLKLYTAMLDSLASEHAARVIAMQVATDNADELLHDLTLQYNKTRQQAITAELLDIVGGSMQ